MRFRTVTSIVGVYAAFATAWILFSDTLVFRLWPEATALYGFGLAKGLAFVAVTAFILYSLMRRLGRAEEDRFQSVFEGHPAAMLLLDPGDAAIIDANPAAAALYGWSRERLRTLRVSDLDTQPAVAVLAALDKARNRQQDSFRFRHRTAGGERDVAVFAGPAEIGGRTLVFAVVQDVTERLRGEEMQRASEAHHRRLFDQSPLGLVLCRMDGQLSYVNPAFARIVGRSVEECLKLTYWEITPAEYGPQERTQLDLLNTSGRYGPYEKEVVHRDGHRVPVRLHGLIIERDGERCIWSTIEDITEQKAAQAALSASESRLNEAQRVAHVGSWDFDLVDNHLRGSDEFYRIFETDADRFSTSYEAFLAVVHPDDRALVSQVYTRSVAERRPYELIYRLQSGDGRIKSVHSRWETYHDADGKPLRSLGTLQDVTEQQRIQRLLAFGNSVLDRVARAAPLAETLDSITLGIEQLAPGALCSILLLDAGGQHLHHGSAPSLPPEYSRAIDGIPIGPSAGSCGTAVYRDEAVIVTDIASDPLWADYRDLALGHGLLACWSTPIHAPGGAILGSFAVYYQQPRSPGETELSAIDSATALAAVAIERARATEALAAAAEVVEASPVVLFRWRPEAGWPVEYVSENISRWGYRAADLLSGAVTFVSIVHADDLARVGDEVDRYTRQGRVEFTQVYRMLRADRTTMWIEDCTTVIRDGSGGVLRYQGTVTDITERRQAEERLEAQLDELQRWYRITVGREARVQELKGEVNALLAEHGRSPRYANGDPPR